MTTYTDAEYAAAADKVINKAHTTGKSRINGNIRVTDEMVKRGDAIRFYSNTTSRIGGKDYTGCRWDDHVAGMDVEQQTDEEIKRIECGVKVI